MLMIGKGLRAKEHSPIGSMDPRTVGTAIFLHARSPDLGDGKLRFGIGYKVTCIPLEGVHELKIEVKT